MIEETNNNIEIGVDTPEDGGEFEDFFADSAEGQGEQQGEDALEFAPEGKEAGGEQSANQSGDVKPEAQPESPRYKVKYNHQELELPVEELITYAQKGMNYDHVASELSSLKNAKEFAVLDKFAKQNNMTREQYLQFLENSHMQTEIQARINAGTPPQVAQKEVELSRREMTLAEREEQIKQQEEREKQLNQLQNQFAKLFEVHPEAKELPTEVIEAVSKGEEPISAYRAYENRQLKEKLKVLQQSQKNTAMAIGSVKGDAGANSADAFLSGFMD